MSEIFFSGLDNIRHFVTYFFISRVIHPLFVYPEQPKCDAKINAVAGQISSTIPNYADMGHEAIFVFCSRHLHCPSYCIGL
jgi:hypothetical protein